MSKDVIVYWINDKELYVKVGDLEIRNITPYEAKEMFKDNKDFIEQLNDLLNIKEEIQFDNFMQKQDYSIENDYNIELIKIEIDEAIDKIIQELDLKKETDDIGRLKNCCLVQKYIAEHNSYDGEIMNAKKEYKDEDIVILDLYNAVVLHNSVCTSNALMFKKILERVEEKAEVIGLISTEGGFHAANIVELNGLYYFFDSTLEKSIYEANKEKTNGQIKLCCAGLGKEEYCRYYEPKVVLPDNPLDQTKQLPENIAQYRIPFEIVNVLIQTPEQKNI